MENKPEIKVFITKTRKFRARIKETKNSIPYEVTIGGFSWEKGKGKEHEAKIKLKCSRLIEKLNFELEKVWLNKK
jgi:hypothetical protein